MKNPFKKAVKTETSTIQKLDKDQLEKVIGGTETSAEDQAAEEARKNTPRYIVKADGIV